MRPMVGDRVKIDPESESNYVTKDSRGTVLRTNQVVTEVLWDSHPVSTVEWTSDLSREEDQNV